MNYVEQVEVLVAAVNLPRQLTVNGRDSEVIPAYHAAIALIMFMEGRIALMGDGEGTSVVNPKSVLKSNDATIELSRLRNQMATDAIRFCIQTDQGGKAQTFLALVKGRKLQLQAARRSMLVSSIQGELDLIAVAGVDSKPHLDESKLGYSVGLLELFYDSEVKEVFVLISKCANGNENTRWKRLLGQDDTTALHGLLDEFVSSGCEESEHLDAMLNMLRPSFGVLVDELEEEGLDKLIIIPHRFLHLIPWHAVCSARNAEPAMNRFKLITYCSSIVLYEDTARPRGTPASRVAITGSFDVAGLQSGAAGASVFRSNFSNAKHLLDVTVSRNTTKGQLTDLLRRQGVFFYEGHSKADFETYEKGAIECSDGELTFKELLEVPGPLCVTSVVLNSCESSLNGNVDDFQDEYYAIDGAFLAHGVAGVVSTLWAVNDMAAFLLSYKLQVELFRSNGIPGAILPDAINWLRLGKWKIELPLIFQSVIDGIESSENKKQIFKFLELLIQIEKDYFAHPVHWAAWRCSGFTARANWNN